MIDYDETINKFFANVDEFLTRRAEKVKDKDKDEYSRIIENREKIRKIAKNPRKMSDYSNRVNAKAEPDADGFLDGNGQSNVKYLTFRDMLTALEEYYTAKEKGWTYPLEESRKKILDANKRWYFYMGKNFLEKTFVYPFRSPKSFAVYIDAGKEK